MGSSCVHDQSDQSGRPQEAPSPQAEGGGGLPMSSTIANPIYDAPEPAIAVMARAAGVTHEEARNLLIALVRAGYFVAPRQPINAMLDAYLNSYGTPPSTTHSAITGIGKARKRWAAMGTAGTKMALSTKRCDGGALSRPLATDTTPQAEPKNPTPTTLEGV